MCSTRGLAAFTAVGAKVTSFDNSTVQLTKYKLMADRDGLENHLMQGDMADDLL